MRNRVYVGFESNVGFESEFPESLKWWLSFKPELCTKSGCPVMIFGTQLLRVWAYNSEDAWVSPY